jgi:hypothetical protein
VLLIALAWSPKPGPLLREGAAPSISHQNGAANVAGGAATYSGARPTMVKANKEGYVMLSPQLLELLRDWWRAPWSSRISTIVTRQAG